MHIMILDQCRTIPAPVDYKGTLKLEGASVLPLASTFKSRFRPDDVAVQITEPMVGAARLGVAQWQGLSGESFC